MINRYVVYHGKETSEGAAPASSMQSEAEFERLETAMDFVEFYRRKYPDRYFEIRGISYNRSSLHVGEVISGWEPTPPGMRKQAVEDLLTWLLPEEV